MSEKSKDHGVGSLLDYVAWRGDLSFEKDPFNELDSLLTAVLAYANFGENIRTFDEPQRLTIGDLATSDILSRYRQAGLAMSIRFRERLFDILPFSPRFRDIRILDQVNDTDKKRNIQFSAVTLQVPQVGTVIAFRGTDTSVTGWKEDFMMSYVCPVPAQQAALDYLERAAGRVGGDLYLTGHSKGGNLALYAAAHAKEKLQDRMKAVYSFDGPGLDDATMDSPGYRRICSRICSVIPAQSVIGLLMNYHPVYRVVESTASSLLQHEPGTWLVTGNRFAERKEVTAGYRVLDRSLHEWLNDCTVQQRQVFVNTVFSALEKRQKEPELQTEETDMDDTSRRMVLAMLYRLLAIQAGNTWTDRIKKPVRQAVQRLVSPDDGPVCSRIVPVDNGGGGFRQAAEEAVSMSRFAGLDRRDTLRLQLFAEEMMSMIRTITGEMQGEFWIECRDNRYEMHLSTHTAMNREKRKTLIASSASRKNAAGSFLGRLRDAFEHARYSGREDVYLDMPLSDQDVRRRAWDRYEQSVLLRLADDVRISIRGNRVTLTVTKAFAKA